MKFSELAEVIKRQLGEAEGAALCRAICAECAGESVYIPRRFEPPEIRADDTPSALAARHGVSRQTAYNWVNRWRR